VPVAGVAPTRPFPLYADQPRPRRPAAPRNGGRARPVNLGPAKPVPRRARENQKQTRPAPAGSTHGASSPQLFSTTECPNLSRHSCAPPDASSSARFHHTTLSPRRDPGPARRVRRRRKASTDGAVRVLARTHSGQVVAPAHKTAESAGRDANPALAGRQPRSARRRRVAAAAMPTCRPKKKNRGRPDRPPSGPSAPWRRRSASRRRRSTFRPDPWRVQMR